MTVWYFDKYDYLKVGEQELYNYLEEHGTLQDETVDITEKLEETGNDNTIVGPTELNVSLYKSNETSGYFAVIIEPFRENQSNHYLIYYGINGKTIDEENETIKVTIQPSTICLLVLISSKRRCLPLTIKKAINSNNQNKYS
ncbi:MAG: hypothetical protein RBT65_16010 [Methanolobus sp.]|nr:hypothetical protein [Methanolobus sp.]